MGKDNPCNLLGGCLGSVGVLFFADKYISFSQYAVSLHIGVRPELSVSDAEHAAMAEKRPISASLLQSLLLLPSRLLFREATR